MQKTLLLAAGLALAATSALSQSSPRDRDDYDYRDARGGPPDWDGPRGRPMRGDESDRRSGGARFFVRVGDATVAVTCDERESMRACVDTALSMFDRFRLQQGTPTPSPSTAPGSPSAR